VSGAGGLRRGVLIAGGVTLVFLAMIALGIVAVAHRQGLEGLEGTLQRGRPWLLFWRIGVFAVLMVYWRELVRVVVRVAKLDVATAQALTLWRARAGVGLVMMDLVLVEDALGWLGRAAG
jgi:hypothetical protein